MSTDPHSRLLAAIGEAKILEYRDTVHLFYQTLSDLIIDWLSVQLAEPILLELEPEWWSLGNCSEWLVIKSFMVWLTQQKQTLPAQSIATAPPSPAFGSTPADRGRSVSTVNSMQKLPRLVAAYDITPSNTPSQKRSATHAPSLSMSLVVKTEPEDPFTSARTSKVIEILSSDEEASIALQVPRKKAKQSVVKTSKEITRQLSVDRIETLTALPKCWTIPRPGDSVAYLLDLTKDLLSYTDDKGKAKMIIYFPVDRSDRRAIVLFTGEPHNHPMPASTKLSYAGKTKYCEAIHAAGMVGLTVGKCDRGAA